MENPHRKFRRIALTIAGALAVGFLILIIRPEYFSRVKDFLVFDRGDLLEHIKKEISNSGKLISEATQRGADLSSEAIFFFTNKQRTSLGLSPFLASSSLDRVAKRRLDDMFQEGYFEHVSPQGKSAVSEAEVVGYEYISIGENIALGNFASDEALVQAWMDSPGHRANIVSGKFTTFGVATAEGVFDGRRTWIAVQIFARPLADCPTVDEALKAQIEQTQSTIEAQHQELDKRKEELNQLDHRPSQRAEYERKVEEYNTLVGKTNALIKEVEEMIRDYNRGVRSFNACLEG